MSRRGSSSRPRSTGRSKAAIARSNNTHRSNATLPPVLGLLAVRLLEWADEAGRKGMIHVAASELRAERLASILRPLAPKLDVVLFPPWDCLPYEPAPPSREAMGARMAALATELDRLGYERDGRVDEPGEYAVRGQVIDLFPAGAQCPVRIEHTQDRIQAIRRYRAQDQLTFAQMSDLHIDAAREAVLPAEDSEPQRERGLEHRLPDLYPQLETLFDYLPRAILTIEPKAELRRKQVLDLIADAHAARLQLRAGTTAPLPTNSLYVDEADWHESLSGRQVLALAEPEHPEGAGVPVFASEPSPTQSFASYLQAALRKRRRVLLSAATERDLLALARRAEQAAGHPPKPVEDWASVLAAKDGALLSLRADLDRGFFEEASGTIVITAADLLGSRAERDHGVLDREADLLATTALSFGDAVIHLDYGLGMLSGLELLALPNGTSGEAVRLTFKDQASVVVPAVDMDRIWRYAGDAETAPLDRLKGEAWSRRRQEIFSDIAQAARGLVQEARRRERIRAPKLTWPAREYERIARRFPFTETPDQAQAIEECLRDLGSGRPMRRLVCGDVGYGKTEVALRAAAAAVLAGKQVAVIAPTTVLARQHLETFRRRLAHTGIEIGHLSRLVRPAEARRVRQALADGSLRIVIGTHALAVKDIRFQDLGLVVVDEEQRFGAAQKRKLHELAGGPHLLITTATPIPRTFHAATVGLIDVSLLRTPPVRRRAIRTFLLPFNPVTVREALIREHRRGGQSFIVCPRIEDLEKLEKRIVEIVPELKYVTAHGHMPADAIDCAIVGFADGDGDVLLATNIIENGLDVPRANTILIWRADRFGLAQLHQLRGRVGRGRARGIAYLLTDPQQKLAPTASKRLKILESLDRTGAGFEISRTDLDIRGAGDLLGLEQAGHLELIGGELYQHLLHRALAVARGEAPEAEFSPEVNLGAGGFIPDDYVPDAELRLNLYMRLARSSGRESLGRFSEELEDRFGPIPQPARDLLQLFRVRELCRELGITRIDSGPKAIALTARSEGAARSLAQRLPELETRNGRLVLRDSALALETSTKVHDLLDRLAPSFEQGDPRSNHRM